MFDALMQVPVPPGTTYTHVDMKSIRKEMRERDKRREERRSAKVRNEGHEHQIGIAVPKLVHTFLHETVTSTPYVRRSKEASSSELCMICLFVFRPMTGSGSGHRGGGRERVKEVKGAAGVRGEKEVGGGNRGNGWRGLRLWRRWRQWGQGRRRLRRRQR